MSAQKNLTVVVNGVAQVTAARTLQDWLDAQTLGDVAVATALNGQFVPRTQRANQTLTEGDVILTFQPIQGG
jgi:sulfur carrier protein